MIGDVLVAMFVASAIAMIVWLNVRNCQRRAKLTAAERQAEDDESEREGQIW